MARPNEHFVRAARPFLAGERETYATVLLAILLKSYGAEVLDWDPLTVESQVADDFGTHMPQIVYDQLMALMTAMNTDVVYRSVEVFDQTVNAFCRVGRDADQDIPASEEVAWTVFELTANDPDPYNQGPDGEMPFGPDIALYCGVVLADDGIKRPPKTLAFASLPSWAPKELSNDPVAFAGAFQSQQASAEDIDRIVEKNFRQLVSHLQEIGVEPAPALLGASADLPEESQLDQLLPG